jgi:hypothetical protein
MFTVRNSFVAVLVTGAILAPSALAQGGPGGGGGGAGGGGGGGGGGRGGGGVTAPTQFPPAACDGSLDGPTTLGTVVTLPIRDANCLSLLITPTGITVSAVTAAPGWTVDVKRDQPDEIDVIWTNVANPALTHEYRRSQNSVRVS